MYIGSQIIKWERKICQIIFSIILKIETMSKTKYSPEFYNFKVLHVLTFLVA